MMGKFKRFLTLFVKEFDHLNNSLALISGGIIGFSALIIMYEVIMRYLLKRPTTWVNDISEILLVYVTFLGSTWVLRTGGHTKVDVVVMFMKKRQRVVMGIIQDILSIFFCMVFTWITWRSFLDSLITQERTPGGVFSVPLWPVYIVIPFGGILLCLQLLRQILENLAYLSKNNPKGADDGRRIE